MNLDNLNQSQKEYVEDILENFKTLNFKNYNDLKFNSTKTKNIDLIIGQDELVKRTGGKNKTIVFQKINTCTLESDSMREK